MTVNFLVYNFCRKTSKIKVPFDILPPLNISSDIICRLPNVLKKKILQNFMIIFLMKLHTVPYMAY